MNKISLLKNLILILALSPLLTFASTQVSVRILYLNFAADNGSGVIYVTTENTTTRTTVPTCASSNTNVWVFQNYNNSDIFKAQISALLAAYSQNKPVTFFGSGTCAAGTSGELATAVVLAQ
jgi:hypothetical protein